MNFDAARAILETECAALLLGNPSTNKSVQKHRLHAGATEAFWTTGSRENFADRPTGKTNRTKAYLRAYLRINSDRNIPATGIALSDGFIHPDKGCIRFGLENGLIKFVDQPQPHFALTVDGRKFVS